MDDKDIDTAIFLDAVRARFDLKFPSADAQQDFRERFDISEIEWPRFHRHSQLVDRRIVKQAQEDRIDDIRGKFADELSEKFIDSNFAGATRGERVFIQEQIAKEIVAPDLFFEYSLSDMMNGGLKDVRKRYRRNHLKYLRHLWALAQASITAAVVLAVFNMLASPFEIITASLLFLLYTRVFRFASWQFFVTGSYDYASFLRYTSLKQVLGAAPRNDEYEAQWKIEEDLKKSKIEHCITDTGHSIVNLVVYWNLFKLLL
jgi:hypothetical protein